MTSSPIIVWFRRDLRLGDNPALSAAAAAGLVLPLFVLEDDDGPWRPGAASRWWLHHSLTALGGDLAARDVPLLLRRGDPTDVIPRLAAETGASAVFFNGVCEPFAAEAEERLATTFEVRRFRSDLLAEPTEMGDVPTFQAFWRRLMDLPPPPRPLPPPAELAAPDAIPPGERLEDLGLLPDDRAWAASLGTHWTPGEASARSRFEDFLDTGLDQYHVMRDRPDQPGTSRLSPHIHFGEISPGTVWHGVASRDASGAETFLREMGWREFGYHLLHHHPSLPDSPLKAEFARFQWTEDDTAFSAWAEGRTGYPIVDAGMRALAATGWMHNRVRMIVGSFLIKDLLLPWQAGERHFWDRLVDADLAANALGWQWVAGCGADAAPYFRIFNPVLQGEKFDPRGRYVRQWVAELAGLPDLYIHRPWDAPPEVLAQAGVRLGESYPRPIIDHGAARRRALTAYERAKPRGAA